MTGSMNRRGFLTTGSAAIGSSAFVAAKGWAQGGNSPNNRVVVGVMGLSRGRALAQGFAKQPGVIVKYCCDVDQNRAEQVAQAVSSKNSTTPEVIGNFRQILDDQEVDALVCAAPNHWHAPATIYGCKAGKHVYVEKPCSHNPQEGELMVEASRVHDRAVQLGTQRRSSPQVIEAIGALHEGAIGRVYHARCWYTSGRGSIGTTDPSTPPSELDYELWQGPAPRKPFKSNVVHYNWHWFWHWGNGELGNNGVHAIDLARWGLGVDYPVQVVSSGGRYVFDDDQETADTHSVSFRFNEGATLDWQGLSCNRHAPGPFVTFFGTDGALDLFGNGSYTIYDASNKPLKKVNGTAGEPEHIADFVSAIRSERPRELHAEILEGHKSTLLCHLGNIAHRTERALHCNPANGQILNDSEAMKLWSRSYAPGWEPTV